MRSVPAAAPLALAAAAALALACDYDPRGRCSSQQDCLAGQVCAGGVCQAESAPPVNHAPVAAADSYQVSANTMLLVPKETGLLANDADPDGDPLTAEKVAEATYGNAFVEPDGSLRYQPWPSFTGTDSFAYRASDGALRSDMTTVTITVVP
jgi:Bacterial Ig domain